MKPVARATGQVRPTGFNSLRDKAQVRMLWAEGRFRFLADILLGVFYTMYKQSAPRHGQ